MAYEFRPRNDFKVYDEASSVESPSDGSDSEYSRSPARRVTRGVCRSKSKAPTRKIKRKRKNVTRNSSKDKSTKRGRISNKRKCRDQNKETSSDAEPSDLWRNSISGEQPNSPEGRNSSMERHSNSPEGSRCVPKTIMSWLIDCKMVREEEEVCYMNGFKEGATKTGRISRRGIVCNCCQKEMSVWAFEKHAGSERKNPYGHIYVVRTSMCLLDYQTTAWDESKEHRRRQTEPFVPKETASDKNDDACIICGDGGALICCDKCPSTFHPRCMNMEIVPQGGWLCHYCVCKYCGLGGECTQKQLMICSLCDKKFHWACYREFEKEAPTKALDLNCSRLYCVQSCREIHETLESLVGAKNELGEGCSWRLIRPVDVLPSVARHQLVENNSKVVVTRTLMNEAFETTKDRFTNINMIESVVYGRGCGLRRVDCSHFYTFILEKEDEVISAASIRVHGERIAEMPLIATAENHRRKGFCGILLAIIESTLCSLNVQRLLLPATPEPEGKLFSRKYGFQQITTEIRGDIASYRVVSFPFAIRMLKNLTTSKVELARIDGGDAQEVKNQELEDQGQIAENNEEEDVRRPIPDLNLEPPEEDDEENWGN